MRKGHWSETEDAIIIEFMQKKSSWAEICCALGGKRTTKQCRERWSNHLDPTLKKTKWSAEEDQFLIEAQARLGNSWTRIALEMPGRSENEVKNRWYSTVHKVSLSGRKRKVDDLGAAEFLPSRSRAEDGDDFVCDDTEEEGDTSVHTRYKSIENEIYRLFQDVNLFMQQGMLQLDTSDMNLVYARMGYDYLERKIRMKSFSSNEAYLGPRDYASSRITSVATGVLTSSSSIGVDLDVLRDINFSNAKSSERSSPGSFLLDISMNPSPTWFGPGHVQNPDSSKDSMSK